MIEIEAPNGEIVEFPDGTDDATIDRVMRENYAPQAATGGAPADMFLNPETGQMTSRELLRNNVDPSRGMAAIGGGMQGAGFRFGDEAMGGIGLLEGGPDMARFRQEQARAELEANEQAYPWTYGLSEVAGGIASSLGLGGLLGLGGATTTGARARLGAIEGGLFGLGGGEGLEDRIGDAAKFGGFGAALGAAAPAALNLGRLGYDRLVGAPLDSMRSAPNATRASRAVQAAVDRSGRTPDEIQAAITAARQAGQPYTVADAAGNSGQRMLSGIARAPGEARQGIEEFLANRQAGQARRIGGALDEALNAPRNTGNLPAIPGQGNNPLDFTGMTAGQVDSRLRSARSAAANRQYAAAREGAGPVDVRGALAAIDDRIGPMQGSGVTGDAIDDALSRIRRRLAAGRPERSNPRGGAGIAAQGYDAAPTAVELSDFDRVLGVKQDVQDMIGTAVRQGQNNRARELSRIVSELDGALEAASPGYREANDAFSQASRVIDQIDAGRAATGARARTADTMSRYLEMTADQQAAFRAGYSDPLIGKIENAAPGVNNARPLMSEGAQAELRTMAREPQSIVEYLARENEMFRTMNAATGGSMTADNLADAAEMTALDVSPIVNLLSGRFGAAAQQIGATAANAMSGRNTATREEIARLLLSDDVQGALAPALRRELSNARQSSVVEALMRSAGRTLAPF